MCLHFCVFHWDYHMRTSLFMGFQIVFVSRKILFFNLEEECLSCAGTTKCAWKQQYLYIAVLCPLKRN